MFASTVENVSIRNQSLACLQIRSELGDTVNSVMQRFAEDAFRTSRVEVLDSKDGVVYEVVQPGTERGGHMVNVYARHNVSLSEARVGRICGYSDIRFDRLLVIRMWGSHATDGTDRAVVQMAARLHSVTGWPTILFGAAHCVDYATSLARECAALVCPQILESSEASAGIHYPVHIAFGFPPKKLFGLF